MFGSRTGVLNLDLEMEMDQIPAFSLRHARNRIESARCDEGLLEEESWLAAVGKQGFDDRCSLECGRRWRLMRKECADGRESGPGDVLLLGGPGEGAKMQNGETARCVARCCFVTQADATVCNNCSRPAVGAVASAVFFFLVTRPFACAPETQCGLFLGGVSVDCDCELRLRAATAGDARKQRRPPSADPAVLENESRVEIRDSKFENQKSKSRILGHLPPRPPVDAPQTRVGFGVGRLCRAAERTGDATLLSVGWARRQTRVGSRP